MMPATVRRGQRGEDRLTTHRERQSHGTTHYLWVGPYYVEGGSDGGRWRAMTPSTFSTPLDPGIIGRCVTEPMRR
jgi:hypothetical protein